VIDRVTAVYQDGVLKPTRPVPVPDGTRVELVVVTLSPPAAVDSPDEMERRRQLIAELHAMDAEVDAEPDDGYDLIDALNENRKRSGARPLIPEPEDRA
jgi:predicted DNA-binding antitoxin AbrB/MazE fold protein